MKDVLGGGNSLYRPAETLSCLLCMFHGYHMHRSPKVGIILSKTSTLGPYKAEILPKFQRTKYKLIYKQSFKGS